MLVNRPYRILMFREAVAPRPGRGGMKPSVLCALCCTAVPTSTMIKRANLVTRLTGKPRETFLYFIKTAADEADSESQAKALWEIAKVRALGTPQELVAAIRSGDVPKSSIDKLLLSAMHNGNWAMAEVLITNGATLAIQTADDDAYTPLHYAVWYNHAGITRTYHGADPNKPNGRGRSSLEMAQDRKCSQEVLRLLSGDGSRNKR